MYIHIYIHTYMLVCKAEGRVVIRTYLSLAMLTGSPSLVYNPSFFWLCVVL